MPEVFGKCDKQSISAHAVKWRQKYLSRKRQRRKEYFQSRAHRRSMPSCTAKPQQSFARKLLDIYEKRFQKIDNKKKKSLKVWQNIFLLDGKIVVYDKAPWFINIYTIQIYIYIYICWYIHNQCIVLVKLYLALLCHLFFLLLPPDDKSTDFFFHLTSIRFGLDTSNRRRRRGGGKRWHTGFPLIKRKGGMRYRSAGHLPCPLPRPLSSHRNRRPQFI